MDDICYRTRRKHPARPPEPARQAECDDVSHVTFSAGHLHEAATDENTRAVLWHGREEIRSAPVTISRIFEKSSRAGRIATGRLMDALVNFDTAIVAAVHGAAIGGDHMRRTAISSTRARARNSSALHHLAVVPAIRIELLRAGRGSVMSVPRNC